ncbi:MAG TPA: sugar phosphate isomerase/epimerase family protein [Flavitalea sp.]|nr:sugar phosphate isomerase/epimerase family protein [Flavitalea sp.]
MIYGLNTFLFQSPFTNDSFHLIQQFKSWGFDSIEIAIEDPAHVDPASLKKVLDDNGMICGSVCAALGPGRDLRGTREEQNTSLDYMKALLDMMPVFGSPVLVGPLYSAVGRAEPRDDDEYKRQWDLVVKHLQTLSLFAGERNIRLAIEPLNRYETDFLNTCSQAMKLVNDIDHAAAGILLDTYHMNIEEKNSASAIRAAASRLYHFHACGCDRGAPGNDHINWPEISSALKEINYNSGVVIESFTTDVKVIAKAASIWRDFEPSKEDIAVKGLRFLKGALSN